VYALHGVCMQRRQQRSLTIVLVGTPATTASPAPSLLTLAVSNNH
jgi:hypothetical protein